MHQSYTWSNKALAGVSRTFACTDSELSVYSGGNTLLASGAKDNKIRLWTPSGACLATGDGHAGAVSALAFSRKSSSFLVSGGVDKILKVSSCWLQQPEIDDRIRGFAFLH